MVQENYSVKSNLYFIKMKIAKYSIVVMLILIYHCSYSQDNTNDSAQNKNISLDEIVISANRFEES